MGFCCQMQRVKERKKIMQYEEIDLFDFLPEEEAEKYRPIRSTDWKWTFADYPKEKNGLKVFSCFACGGGSTMGYKLAGCDVLGCCEIDPKMNKIYVKNHNPKYNFLMDIRDFNKTPNEELPQELFNLDILDGSPPCTTFSIAGEREKSWGKKKKFREGQAEQTLDDLSFVFIETVNKLKPKTVIMENVEGLLFGEAWKYVQEIYKHFKDIGYQVKHYLCKGEQMGVPQRRHRVFFIAARKDIDFNLDELDMSFNYEPILFKEIKTEHGEAINPNIKIYKMLLQAQRGDKSLADVCIRLYNKKSFFNYMIVNEDEVVPTITAGSAVCPMRFEDKSYLSIEDIIHAQTFPEDYDFGERLLNRVRYICGMSVPPIMTKRVVKRLIATGVFEKQRIKSNERKRG